MITLNGFIESHVLGHIRLALRQQRKWTLSLEEAEKKGLACGSLGGFEIYFKPTKSATMPISLELNERIFVHVTEKQKSVIIQVQCLPLSSSDLVGHPVVNEDWQ